MVSLVLSDTHMLINIRGDKRIVTCSSAFDDDDISFAFEDSTFLFFFDCCLNVAAMGRSVWEYAKRVYNTLDEDEEVESMIEITREETLDLDKVVPKKDPNESLVKELCNIRKELHELNKNIRRAK